MGDFGDCLRVPGEPDDTPLEWARRTSREVQAAHAAGVSPDFAMERIREAAARKRELAAAADPDAWLTEYRKVMAEDLSLSGEELDQIAPYTQDPIPGLSRLIAATAPPSRRARRAAGRGVPVDALVKGIAAGLLVAAVLMALATLMGWMLP